MGQAKTKQNRQEELKKAFPLCCWCQTNPSAEIDHIPPRSFFIERKWPEGFEFPACKSCNLETRKDEQVFATLARVMPEPKNKKEMEAWEKLANGMAENNKPAFLELWQGPNARQSPYLLKNGVYQQYKTWNIGPEINKSLSALAIKLIKGLHIKATGKLAPKDANIIHIIVSNGHAINGQATELIKMKPKHTGISKRDNNSLYDQFLWQYDFDEKACVVKATFRQSFIVTGIIDYNKGAWPPKIPKIIIP